MLFTLDRGPSKASWSLGFRVHLQSIVHQLNNGHCYHPSSDRSETWKPQHGMWACCPVRISFIFCAERLQLHNAVHLFPFFLYPV